MLFNYYLRTEITILYLNKRKNFSRESIINNLIEAYPEAYFDLRFFSFKLDEEKKKRELFNLEFRPHYNKSIRFTDSGSGRIELKERPFNKFSKLSGSIFHHGSMITRVNLPISEGFKSRTIPLIDISGFENYLDKNKLKGIGGSLLIDFGENDPMRVQIDSAFEKKIYLDRNLNVSEFFGNHRFTFFIGVSPGNTLLTLIKSKGRFSEKIVFVENSEDLWLFGKVG